VSVFGAVAGASDFGALAGTSDFGPLGGASAFGPRGGFGFTSPGAFLSAFLPGASDSSGVGCWANTAPVSASEQTISKLVIFFMVASVLVVAVDDLFNGRPLFAPPGASIAWLYSSRLRTPSVPPM
jgi:hypothetical protein